MIFVANVTKSRGVDVAPFVPGGLSELGGVGQVLVLYLLL